MHLSRQTTNNRIESIDIIRGIAMVIMALDHVRDYFHITANIDDPLNLATTTPLLFFTRWITHFCAPVFVFLSGVSIYLQSLRKSKKNLSKFLLKRGLWLIFAEFFIISLAWTFDPGFHILPMQVIWTIGISMIILGLMIRLPFKLIFITGLAIVTLHNLLDIPEAAPGFKPGFLWELLHHGFFVVYPIFSNHYFLIVYPFVAWSGLMMLGYCAGILFTGKFSSEQRKKILLRTGIGLLLLFVILRATNFYGDPVPWEKQQSSLNTFLSFINVHKYPPSLLYLSLFIGIAFLLLALMENKKNRFSNIMIIYGRTAFFYYILHLYLIHILAAIAFFIKGNHSVEEAITSMKKLPFLFVIPGEGFGLGVVYFIWFSVVAILYPVCKKYDRYKTTHKEKWWLSYL